MENFSKKFSLKKRRGISNIIGSLIVLAVVASVGSVILFQGLNQITAFQFELSNHDREKVSELRESILFEHIQFNPTNNEITLYLANTGSIDTTITSVTIVQIDTQDVVLINQNLDETILIEDHVEITLHAYLPDATPTPNVWDSPEYNSSNYKINIGTSRGNYFPFDGVEPFYT